MLLSASVPRWWESHLGSLHHSPELVCVCVCVPELVCVCTGVCVYSSNSSNSTLFFHTVLIAYLSKQERNPNSTKSLDFWESLNPSPTPADLPRKLPSKVEPSYHLPLQPVQGSQTRVFKYFFETSAKHIISLSVTVKRKLFWIPRGTTCRHVKNVTSRRCLKDFDPPLQIWLILHLFSGGIARWWILCVHILKPECFVPI